MGRRHAAHPGTRCTAIGISPWLQLQQVNTPIDGSGWACVLYLAALGLWVAGTVTFRASLQCKSASAAGTQTDKVEEQAS